MVDNSQQILNDVLSQLKQERAPDLSDQDYFELFCAEQILKDYDLSYDEIESGIVDGEGDGGIDAIYSFVNGELVYEDFDTSSFKRGVVVDLHIIQSKTAGGFSEVPVDKFISVSRNLLNLTVDISSFDQYNDGLKAVFENFRSTYRNLAAKFPKLQIHYHYASKKADQHVHPNLEAKAKELVQTLKDMFPDSEVDLTFLGARTLLDLARKQPLTTHNLRVIKSLNHNQGFIVLSKLSDYCNFLNDENGKISAELFESNVRDFQGNTEVNSEISNTLKTEAVADFWWMNNGVTILANKAAINGDDVVIENPQIVNGLQTSTQIARWHSNPGGDDDRSIMIKIISSEDEETRDKIIKATNRQNSIQPASLRATDKIQRDIEETLKSNGLYYDRRKNFYKNEGKPADKIISIPLMTQSTIAIILARPDSARARPSSLIKDDEVYAEVYSESHPINLYVNAAKLIKLVDGSLKSRQEILTHDRTNIRFYSLYWLPCMLTNTTDPTPTRISNIDVAKIDPDVLEESVDKVLAIYAELGGGDQLAKGAEFLKVVKTRVKAEISAKFSAK